MKSMHPGGPHSTPAPPLTTPSPLQPSLSSEDVHRRILAKSQSLDDIQSGYQREQGLEDPFTARWIKRSKHFFILSNSGKPVYSRYGDESKLSSLMGVIQAIMSFYIADNDAISGSHLIVFAAKGPLYFIAVSSLNESESRLRRQLNYLYHQVLFTLTHVQLHKIFKERINFDLRHLLAGTDMFMDRFTSQFRQDPSLLLGSIPCLWTSGKLKASMQDIMMKQPPSSLLFGLLLYKNKLIHLVRPRHVTLKASDVLLLVNMVNSSTAFKQAEAWVPICLPAFNAKGFLHAHVSYLPDSLVCLVLLSVEKDAFFQLSDYRQTLIEEFQSNGIMQDLDEAIEQDPYHVTALGIPGLCHFIFRSKIWMQHTEPYPLPPYSRPQDYTRLMDMYDIAYNRMYPRLRSIIMNKELGGIGSESIPVASTTGNKETPPCSSLIVHLSNDYETVFACTTSNFDMFAAFSPFSSKHAILSAMTSIQKWVKRNEMSIFLTHYSAR